jgi:hypothetical protein
MKRWVGKTRVKKQKKVRRQTMRGGFRDVKDACDQIAKAKTDSEAKKIFRKAAIKFHPDKGGSEEDMKKLKNCLDDKLEGGPEWAPEEEPAPPKPAPAPPKPKPAPAPAPEPPKVSRVNFILIPKGSSIESLDYIDVDTVKRTLINAYKTNPIPVTDYVLQSYDMFLLRIEKGVTEEEFLSTMVEQGANEGDIERIGEYLQDVYPEISFPTKQEYDLVVFI